MHDSVVVGSKVVSALVGSKVNFVGWNVGYSVGVAVGVSVGTSLRVVVFAVGENVVDGSVSLAVGLFVVVDNVGERVVGSSVLTTTEIVGLFVDILVGLEVGSEVGALVPMRFFGRHIK